jgi:hypothetical protein
MKRQATFLPSAVPSSAGSELLLNDPGKATGEKRESGAGAWADRSEHPLEPTLQLTLGARYRVSVPSEVDETSPT